MPSRKMSSTSAVCAAAPLTSAAARTLARLPSARRASFALPSLPISSASERSSSVAGGTTEPG
jgi:hypothetical protein